MSDDGPILWHILFQLALIAVNAIFACAEIAVISINDAKLQRMAATGDKRAIRLRKLTDQPARFLATIQVAITLAGFLASAFAAENFSGRIVGWLVGLGVTVSVQTLDTIAIVAITIVLSFFTLILGELVPKRAAMRNAERLALMMSGLVYLISVIFAPLVSLLTASTNAVLRMFGIDPNAEDEEVTEEEIRMMVDVGNEKGTIDSEEKEMIHNIFEFDSKTAGEVMTHRTKVDMLWLDENDDAWEKTIMEGMHLRYPVCNESADNIVGILNIKDYFRLPVKTRDQVMQHAVKPAMFVPESVRADILFGNMKRNQNHIVVVIDEYGGMSGIVTMSDLLEQIVGEFDDGYEVSFPDIEKLDAQTWRIRGQAALEDVSTELGCKLPLDDYETFGGLVFGLLGTIPEDGSKPELESFGLAIKVQEIKEHRMELALVCVAEPALDSESVAFEKMA